LPIPPPSPRLFLGIATAYAGDPDRDELVATLHRYADVYQRAARSRDPDLLAGFYEHFDANRRAALQRYFENAADDLTIAIDDVDVRSVAATANRGSPGTYALVAFTRTDSFTDRQTGEQQFMKTRLTRVFVRSPSGWVMAPEE
jgi:hypothetical protein